MTKPKRKAVSTGKPGSELVAPQIGTAYVARPKRVPLPGEEIAGGFMSDWQAKRGGG